MRNLAIGCLLLAIVALAGNLAWAETVYTYDFDSLTGSANPGTPLPGQDGWVNLRSDGKYAIGVRNEAGISGWPGFNINCTSRAASSSGYHGKGSGVYTITDDQMRMEMTARVTSYYTAAATKTLLLLGIWADDGDNAMERDPPTKDEYGFLFGFNVYDTPVIQPAAGGTTVTGTVPGGAIDSGDVWRLVLDVDLTANSGNGAGSLSMKYLGDTDGTFDVGKSLALNPVTELQNINLNIQAMGASKTVSGWHGLMLRQNYALMDDVVIASVPEPSTLILLLGMLLAIVARRAR